MFSLRHKVIVITGGNGLLGRKMVSTLTENGAIVIAADISIDHNDPQQRYLDITDEGSVMELINEVVKQHGRIDGWVNNAYPRTSDWGLKVDQVPFQSWKMNVDMHLNGYFLCCQKVLHQMQLQNSGSLINMASIYGIVGPDFSVYDDTAMTMPVAYSAIKGGLINLSRYLAAYYGPYQICVNCISPGGIFDGQPETFVHNYTKKVPLRRMGVPADICNAVFFLLSDEANYITGHNLVVDGGWTAI